MSLPGLGVSWIKAKIDSGAQTSALHANDITEFERDGDAWVRFTVYPWQNSSLDASTVELPIHDRRTVRSSSGHAEDRLVVMTEMKLVGRLIQAEITLTSRAEMVFPMLVGREALRQGFLVDSGAAYLGGKPPLAIRRRNRGHA